MMRCCATAFASAGGISRIHQLRETLLSLKPKKVDVRVTQAIHPDGAA